jgi:phosphatidylinositol-3-phosphatase
MSTVSRELTVSSPKLASGDVPSYSFIAPNQCTDQHGRDNAGPQCDFDPNDNGTQVGLNPALISIGD